MYNHAPDGYICPFCYLAKGVDDVSQDSKQADIVYQNKDVTAFVSASWWPNNPGHVIIIPNNHYENLYDIPDDVLANIHIFSKKIAHAMKATYKCEGVSIRQHNEPAGNQDTWHYHLQVFPRYEGDELYLRHKEKRKVEPKERLPFVEKLKIAL
jgi:histidine triad (HIT) family protein